MTTEPQAGATIRLVDVFAKQIEMGAQLAVITEQLKQIPDHEQRIRALERWRYSLPLAMVAGVGSAAVSVWSLVRH